jgi:hypothetical protein
MNTLQLECALKHVAPRVGVYAADQIPRGRTRGFIVNTQGAHLPGEHWVAFWENNGKLEFFDSFGQKPTYYGFQSTKTYNTVVLQSPDSNTCGLYALFYVMCKSRGYTLEQIQNMFCTNTGLNDYLMYLFASELFSPCM